MNEVKYCICGREADRSFEHEYGGANTNSGIEWGKGIWPCCLACYVPMFFLLGGAIEEVDALQMLRNIQPEGGAV